MHPRPDTHLVNREMLWPEVCERAQARTGLFYKPLAAIKAQLPSAA